MVDSIATSLLAKKGVRKYERTHKGTKRNNRKMNQSIEVIIS